MGLRLPKTKGMLRREAANWLARLQSGREPEVERKFERWRDSDPRHAAAFERVRKSYEQAGLLRHSPFARSVPLEPAVQRPEWAQRPALAAAAALAVIVPAGVLLLRAEGRLLAGGNEVMLMTRVGEIRQVELADGSRVTLDTATRLQVAVGRSRRVAHLQQGRARFRVAAAAVPFVIDAAASTTTTNAGVIDVERDAHRDLVIVLVGAAQVRDLEKVASKPIALAEGEAVTVDAGGAERKPAVASAHDWTRGMLQFDGTALADAAALANRYSEQHIVLNDDVGALRVTGAFRAGDTTGLARALAAAFHLSLRRSADGNFILSKGSGQPANSDQNTPRAP